MDYTDLLRTRLSPPRLRTMLVARGHLLDRLNTALERSQLTLISAPAGFGKTTLLVAWLASLQDNDVATGWVSLEAGDNDPERFWRYVIAACRSMDESIGTMALMLLGSPERGSLEGVVISLINDIAGVERRGILVLEDYHLITSKPLHDAILFLLEHQPANLHIVLTTRSDPPFSLARLRARNALTELRVGTLRFSTDEMATFLNEVAGIELAPEEIARLETQIEGWVAGLQLASLLLQGQPDHARFLNSFTGSQRHIMEYLVEEVLLTQPAQVQDFLLRTSLPERLTGSLCNALTGEQSGEQMLEQLERANLFLIPLDDEQRWYRYHALFAEALRHYAGRQLGQECLHELYSRACDWYEARGLPQEAIEMALKAQDFSHATQLIEHVMQAPRVRYNFTLHRWLDSLPQELLYSYPATCFLYAQSLLFSFFSRSPDAVYLKPLQRAEELWRAEGDMAHVGSIYALRTLAALWNDDPARVFSHAEYALSLLPEHDVLWRGISLAAQGSAYRRLGDARKGYLSLRTACELSEQAEFTFAIMPTLNALADVLVQLGRLQEAAQIYRQVIARSGPLFTDSNEAHTCLGTLYFEWNDLTAAETELQPVVRETRGGKRGEPLAHAHLTLARVKRAQGEIALAQTILQQLIEQALQGRFPIALEELLAYRAWWSLANGPAQERVHDWLQTLDLDAGPLYTREQTYIIAARILIARGEPSRALQVLSSWRMSAHEQGRIDSEITLSVLSALALYAQNEPQTAQQLLMQALTLAQPEGYMRVFLEEGITLAALLRSLRPRVLDPTLASYVDTLLAAFASERSSESLTLRAPPVPAALMEPLSQHEYRVLRLLVAGLSNPEIATELIVSVNTVKTHVKNIYSKLNVSNRKEAREAAQRLKLF